MLQFMGLQKVEHNLVTEQNQFLDQEQQHLLELLEMVIFGSYSELRNQKLDDGQDSNLKFYVPP